nr:MAG: hypothetical protein DIU61_17720 [Bacteroidota bacterium]
MTIAKDEEKLDLRYVARLLGKLNPEQLFPFRNVESEPQPQFFPNQLHVAIVKFVADFFR